MIELELLGVAPDGETLSLNDGDGNRYSLPITAALRAAVRKDVTLPPAEPRPITPREIQALFRKGASVDEVAQLSSLPAAQLFALEHPIAAERRYTADQARSFRQAHELGGLTIDELVVSRLIERGVTEDGITWDAYREPGSPWTLSASYSVEGTAHTALWRINNKAQAVTALNDEATWLTETQVPAPFSPWRARNTPPIDMAQRQRDVRASGTGEQITDRDNSAAPATDSAAFFADTQESSAGDDFDLDSVLANLDSQRGKAQPMPIADELADEEDLAAGAAADSDDEDAGSAAGATIIAFPNQQKLPGFEEKAGSTSSSEDTDASTASAAKSAAEAGKSENKKAASGSSDKPKAKQARSKKRNNRPTMPSWDEIVFGYSKNSDTNEAE